MTIKLNLSGHFNQSLADLGFNFPGSIQVDPTAPIKDTASKMRDFLVGLGIGSGDHVTVAVPGMSSLAVITVTAIHGLTGQFPTLVALVRQSDGSFVATDNSILDLQNYRNDSVRINRENVISL